MADYYNNTVLINELQQKNQGFKKLCEKIRKMKSLGLSSYLISVVQRAPKYIVMVRQILKRSVPEDRIHLSRLSSELENLSGYCDELVSLELLKETERELLAGHNLLNKNVHGEKKITIVTKGRSYVMQGHVKKFASSGIRSNAREYTFYLLSDVLMYANKITVDEEMCTDSMTDLIRDENMMMSKSRKRRKARKYKEQLEHSVRENGKKELAKGQITQSEYENMLNVVQDVNAVFSGDEDVSVVTEQEPSAMTLSSSSSSSSSSRLSKSSSSRRGLSKNLSKYGIEYQKSSYLRKRHRRYVCVLSLSRLAQHITSYNEKHSKQQVLVCVRQELRTEEKTFTRCDVPQTCTSYRLLFTYKII